MGMMREVAVVDLARRAEWRKTCHDEIDPYLMSMFTNPCHLSFAFLSKRVPKTLVRVHNDAQHKQEIGSQHAMDNEHVTKKS